MPKPRDLWDEEDKKRVLLNFKAKLILASTLIQNEYFCISNCQTTKEMWEALEIAYEGTTGIKENRLNTLVGEYELFRMKEGEMIKDIQIIYMHIINQMITLGMIYSQQEQARKILRALPLKWQLKFTAIKKSKGKSMWSIAALFDNLVEYEGKIAALKEVTEKKKKKGIALWTKADDEGNDKDEKELDDEDLGMLVKKYGKFFKRKKNFKRPPKRDGTSSKKDNKDQLTCFKCKKVGHIKWECPQWQKKQEKEKKKEKSSKKKVYIYSI